jgi:hypothetical protein
MHKRKKKQNPETLWNDVRDANSPYRQLENGPDNDSHQGAVAARTQQDVAISGDPQVPHYGEEDAPRLNPAIVSAPVTRDGNWGHSPPQMDPKRVRLSPDELAIAKASGLTPTQYAAMKIRLMREREADPLKYRKIMAGRGDFDMSKYKAQHSVTLDRYGYSTLTKRSSGGRTHSTRPTEENLASPASVRPVSDAGHNIRTRRRSGGGAVDESDILAMQQDDAELRAKLQQKYQDKSEISDATAPQSEVAGAMGMMGEMKSGVMSKKFQMSRLGGITANRQPQPSIGDIEESALATYDPDPDQNQQ